MSTVYGVEAVYDMLEIVRINAHNQRLYQKHLESSPSRK